MTVGQNIGVRKISSALKVKGPDSFRFLNGMLTQDVQTSATPQAARSFLLTNKGRIICPLYFVSLSKDEVVLWTEEKDFELLHQTLSKYLIADKVELTPLGKFTSWTLVESEFQFEKIKNKNPLGLEKIFTAIITENYYVVPQARLSDSHAEVLCLKGELPAKEITTEEFWKVHYTSEQAQWGIDLFQDDFFLEFPLADAVSFDKGCYIGQETVARGTFRGKVNKSYAHFEAKSPPSVGDLQTEAGDKMGQIRSVQGTKATGIAKFDQPEQKIIEIKTLVNEETFRKGR